MVTGASRGLGGGRCGHVFVHLVEEVDEVLAQVEVAPVAPGVVRAAVGDIVVIFVVVFWEVRRSPVV